MWLINLLICGLADLAWLLRISSALEHEMICPQSGDKEDGTQYGGEETATLTCSCSKKAKIDVAKESVACICDIVK